MIRVILLAAALPLAAMAQLELTLYDGSLIASPYNLGSAATCRPLTVPVLLVDDVANAISITTLEPISATSPIVVSGAYLPPFELFPNRPQGMNLVFTPTSVGPYTATFVVQGTDEVTGAQYNLSIVLTAQGVAAPTLTDSTGHQYCSGDSIDIGRTQVGATVQTSLTLNNATQTPAAVSVTGADFALVGGPFTVQPDAPPQTFQISFTPSIANQENAALQVNDLSYTLVGNGFVGPTLQPTIAIAGAANTSSSQAQLSIPLAAAATATATGQLTLAFHSAGNLPDDPTIEFIANSSRTMSVQVSPGDTAVHFTAGDPNACTFQTGTTAGTIAFALSIGGASATQSLVIPPMPVSLDLATASAATNQIIVALTGFDNTHAASMLGFTFYDGSGKAISPGLIQANVAGDFAGYYAANPSAGGAFALQATFPVSGDITQVATVEVQFTNPQGATTTPRIPVD